MVKEHLVVLFGDSVDAEAALDKISMIVPAEDLDLRVVDFGERTPGEGVLQGWAIGLPMPAMGGAAPASVGFVDLNVEKDERRFIEERAGNAGVVVDLSAAEEFMPQIRELVSETNGQFYTREK